MLRIGITQGDPNGIGPEIIIKSLSPEGMTELMTPVIFANKGVITSVMQRLKGEKFRFQPVKSAADAKDGKINLVHVGGEVMQPEYGKVTPEGGRSAYLALEAAVEALENGDIDVLVTAPINKSAIQSEDFHFPGHTEYLEARLANDEAEEPAEDNENEEADAQADDSEPTAGPDYFGPLPQKAQMILYNDNLRVALLTTHLPLTEISQYITQGSVIEAVRRLDRTLRRDFACERPRIAVLALNPHAGDEGLLGKEEQEEIKPAIRQLKDNGILAFGPYAADGFFGSGEWKNFDGVLAMYHDQGLAPFKTIAGRGGVNYTAGLDYIRTSPDHGTAYDIAGEMTADATSMREAIYRAMDIFRARNIFDEASENPLQIKIKSTKEG